MSEIDLKQDIHEFEINLCKFMKENNNPILIKAWIKQEIDKIKNKIEQITKIKEYNKLTIFKDYLFEKCDIDGQIDYSHTEEQIRNEWKRLMNVK